MKILKSLAYLSGRNARNDELSRRLEAAVSPHVVCTAIGEALSRRKPFLVSRLGWFETYSVGHYDLYGDITPGLREKMWNTPGIFPPSVQQFAEFHAEYTRCIPDIDILGLMSCPHEASVVERYAPHAARCRLQDLEPYYQPVPWSKYLADRRILVVHPFAVSIESQYRNARKRLFLDQDVLPDFNLLTLKPPQTLCGNNDGYQSWSSALADLKDKVSGLDFDAAIIGCGAYGLPLGAFVKNLGKPAVHLGGATQALFGIAGSRWEKPGQPMRFFINPHWVRPDESERPANWKQAEEGCYW